MTSHRLSDLARALGLEGEGDLSRRVLRPAHPSEAGPDDLAVAMRPAYAETLAGGAARAAVLWPGADWRGLGLAAALFAPRPRFAMAGVTAAFAPPPEAVLDATAGVHPSAVVDPTARIDPTAAVGPLCVIGPGAAVGPGTRLGPMVSLGPGARVGARGLIHAGVRIGHGVALGDRAVIHANAVLGADGFSFVTPEPGAIEAARAGGAPAPGLDGRQLRIHSLGGLEIGDDVEIGACATLDRGTLRATRVGDGTKIDNQVQVAHNVEIGRDCLLCAQVGVAGSTVIGDRVVLGGKAGIADNLTIGSDSVIAAGSGVGAKVPPGSVLMGVPAIPRAEFHRMFMAMRRLPRVLERLRSAPGA